MQSCKFHFSNPNANRSGILCKMDESVTGKVLYELRGYLQDNLKINEGIICSMVGKQLLDDNSARRIKALLSKGEEAEAVYMLLGYMSSFYNDDLLVRFCDFLEKSSTNAKAKLRDIAREIRSKISW